MKRKSVFVVIMVIAMLAAMFAGCTPKAADPGTTTPDTGTEPIKVGFIGPLTGPVAQYGIAVRNGVQMYIDEINAAGGVLGRQVELYEYDDQHDQAQALNGLNSLVYDKGVVAIFGGVTSTPTEAIAQKSAQMDSPIPMITASATADSITSYSDNMFRTCFNDSFQGDVMARFAIDEMGAKTAAIIVNMSDDYSVGLKEAFVARCEAEGVEVVAIESYTEGTTDFKSLLTNIQAKNPDVLFVPNYYEDVRLICAQSAEIGLTCPKLGADGWDGILEEGIDASVFENCYFSNHGGSPDNPAIAKFNADYKTKFGMDALSFSGTAYDAAKIMFAAMEAAGSTDSAAVIAALKATNLECLTDTYSYDEFNNPIKQAAIIKVADGEYVFERMM